MMESSMYPNHKNIDLQFKSLLFTTPIGRVSKLNCKSKKVYCFPEGIFNNCRKLQEKVYKSLP